MTESKRAEAPMADPTPEPSWGLRGRWRSTRRGSPARRRRIRFPSTSSSSRPKSVLKTEAFDYVAGGAGSEETVRANRDAFRRWRIVPRFLRDVSRRDLAVDVLGLKLRAPVMLAPIGVQSILHKEGELAVARAARALGVPMILSTVSSYTMEAVAGVLGDTSALVSALLASRR